MVQGDYHIQGGTASHGHGGRNSKATPSKEKDGTYTTFPRAQSHIKNTEFYLLVYIARVRLSACEHE